MKYILFASLFTFASFAMAANKDYSITGNAEFIATGKPGFIKIDGVGKGLTGTLKVTGNTVTGEASFPLDSLDTGVGLRDRHLKEGFLEVQKFPDAQFTLTHVLFATDPEVDGFNQDKVPFIGLLLVHGVSHPVSGLIDVQTKSGVTTGDAEFPMKISDFAFAEPKFMGMRVNDDVQVKVHIETNKAKTE